MKQEAQAALDLLLDENSWHFPLKDAKKEDIM